MSYSTEYNKEKYIEIEKYLSQLETLDKEKVLSIPTDSPEEAEHLRWLFYDYLHLTGSKGVYTLKVFNDLLLIGKVRATMSNLTTRAQVKNVTQQLSTIVEVLITARFPREFICNLVRDEKHSFTTLSIILAEYGRVMGE